MDVLKDKIKSSRNIKDKSLNAYLISLRKLHEKINPDKEFPSTLSWLKNKDKVMEHLVDMKLTTRKNYIAAIIVALSIMFTVRRACLNSSLVANLILSSQLQLLLLR